MFNFWQPLLAVNASPVIYAASALSRALPGWSKRRILSTLNSVKPAGLTVVGSNVAPAWSLEQLPSPLLVALETRRQRDGFGGLDEVLEHPHRRWEPPVPVARADRASLLSAQRLQRALSRCLESPSGTKLARRARIAGEDYPKQFGRSVTPRRLCTLIARTIERDGGLREWTRLAIYLPDNVRERAKGPSSGSPLNAEFGELEKAIQEIPDHQRPTATETAHLWRQVVGTYVEALATTQGVTPVKRALKKYLLRYAPFLARNASALNRNLDRKLAAAEEGIAALTDGRLTLSGRRRQAPGWTENMALFAARTRASGGRESQAWRELHLGTAEGQRFTEAFRDYYPFDVRNRKSQVPVAARAAVRPMIQATDPIHLGPKAAKLKRPSLRRGWSDTKAGWYFQSDDETINHYWFERSQRGEYEYQGMRFNVGRGQCLPMVDLRTDLPLSFVLLPNKSYNSWAIRTLCARTLSDERVGLPHKGVYFEGGIWAARNVEAQFGWAKVDEGFARQGIELALRHARTPKSKIIESIFGRTQNMMEGWPGYVGRDERNVHYERVQKFLASLKRVGQPRKAEVDPGEMLLDKAGITDRLHKLFDQFAHEPQNGERLAGLSPAEAWVEMADGRSHPRLPESLRHLLSTHFSEQKVTGEGIRLRIGQVNHHYFGSEKLGALIGEKVRVGYNPDLPEQVSVVHLRADPKGLSPFAVPLFTRLPATTATREDFERAREQQQAFSRYGQMTYRLIAPPRNLTVVRTDTGSAEARAHGEKLNALEREHIELRERRETARGDITRLAGQQDLSIDPAGVQRPERVRESLTRRQTLEARIRAAEAAEAARGRLDQPGEPTTSKP